MKTTYNWKELLILAGIRPIQNRNGELDIDLLSTTEMDLLRQLAQECKMDIAHFCNQPPSNTDWFNAIRTVCRQGRENSDFDQISSINIEFPMNAIVMQFNRLGLPTVGSCGGHHSTERRLRRRPYVEFANASHALLALRVLQSRGWLAKCSRRTLYIDEPIDTRLEIGLFLSRVPNLDDYRASWQAQRERRLLHLLDIPGESGNEHEIGQYLLMLLESRLDKVWMDESGNVLGENLRINPRDTRPTILLSAHQDVVDNSGIGNRIIRQGNTIKRENNAGILGADDRAGIALILNVLDSLSHSTMPFHLKIAFTTEEEVGQIGAEAIDSAFFEDVDFAFSLDRRGKNDIVTRSPYYTYCEDNLAVFIERASENLWSNPYYHYKICSGGTSDLRVWSALGIPSVNLSIGYRHEHTDDEELDLDAWHRAHDLILDSLQSYGWRVHVGRQLSMNRLVPDRLTN